MKRELEIIRYAKIDGIRMFFNTLDYRTPHAHEEWELLFVVENEMEIISARNKLIAKPGQIVVVPPYFVHELHKTNESTTFLCLQIQPHLYKNSSQLANITFECCLMDDFVDEDEMKKVQYSMFRMMEHYLQQKSNFELQVVSEAGLLLFRILEVIPYQVLSDDEMDSMVSKTDRLARFQAFVDENYRYKITLSDFAKQEECSMNYLSTFIKKELNLSFREYVNQVRFYASLKLMSNSAYTLQEICYECGFSDYRYFSRVFQEYTGLLPAQYRKHPVPVSGTSHHVHQSMHSLETFYP